LAEVFQGDVLGFEEVEVGFEAAIAKYQKENGSHHPQAIWMHLGFDGFLLDSLMAMKKDNCEAGESRDGTQKGQGTPG